MVWQQKQTIVFSFSLLRGWEPTKCEDFQQSLFCHLVPLQHDFFAFALGKQSEKHIFFVSFMHCVQFSIQHSNKVAVLAWPLFIFGGGF